MENITIYESEEQKVEIDGALNEFLKNEYVQVIPIDKASLYALLKICKKDLEGRGVKGNLDLDYWGKYPVIKFGKSISFQKKFVCFNYALQALSEVETNESLQGVGPFIEESYEGDGAMYCKIFDEEITIVNKDYGIRGFMALVENDKISVLCFGVKTLEDIGDYYEE